MKKIAMVLALCAVYAVSMFAQSEMDEEKPSIEQGASADMEALQTAYALAKYGYDNNSASALIGAAEILAEIPTQDLDVDVSQEGTQAGTEKAQPYTAEKLLEDGKRLAGKDRTLSRWITKVEKLVKDSGTRGAMGGPRIGDWVVYGNGGTSYCNVLFRGRELASVLVCSYNGCDLDVYIYDRYGNLVTRDTSYALDAYVSWYPQYDAIYRIVVKNASYNDAYCIVCTN